MWYWLQFCLASLGTLSIPLGVDADRLLSSGSYSVVWNRWGQSGGNVELLTCIHWWGDEEGCEPSWTWSSVWVWTLGWNYSDSGRTLEIEHLPVFRGLLHLWPPAAEIVVWTLDNDNMQKLVQRSSLSADFSCYMLPVTSQGLVMVIIVTCSLLRMSVATVMLLW